MKRNLAVSSIIGACSALAERQMRNLSLPGAVFPTPQAQADRFTQPSLAAGRFESSDAKSLWDIRSNVIPKAELDRWV